MAERKVKPNTYVQIQAFMVNELRLAGDELIVYAIIYGFSQDGENRMTGGLSFMANWLGKSKQNVMRAIDGLIEKGLVVKYERWENKVKFCEYAATYNTAPQTEQGCSTDGTGVFRGRNGGCSVDGTMNTNIEVNENNKELYTGQFDAFWTAYPKKKNKPAARRAFDKAIRKPGVTIDVLLNAIKQHKRTKQWQEDNGTFIPYPATWLNAEAWNDELSVADFGNTPVPKYHAEADGYDYNIPEVRDKETGEILPF